MTTAGTTLRLFWLTAKPYRHSPLVTAKPRAGVVLWSALKTTVELSVLTVSLQHNNSTLFVKSGANASIAWIDTKIILDTADPDYINTVAKGEGVTGDMTTSDGGKTWTVTTIKIPQFSFGQSS